MSEQPGQSVYRLRMLVDLGTILGKGWVTYWCASPEDVLAALHDDKPLKYTVHEYVLNAEYAWLPCSEVVIDKGAVFDGGESSGKWVMLPEEDEE